MTKRLFDVLLFTSLFIAGCAVLLVYQTALLFNLRFPFALYLFVLSGAVCSYNFHWYLTPPVAETPSGKLAWSLSNRQLHLALFLFGAGGAAVSSLVLVHNWFWLGVTAALAFLYSAPKIEHPLTRWLRKIAVGKTIFLAAAWAHVTVLFPLLVTAGNPSASQLWFFVNRFFFLYAICIVFDRRDVAADRAAGIKSLVTYFNDKGVDRLFWVSIFFSLLTLVFLYQWLPLLDLVLLAVPLFILSLLYEPSRKNTSDYLYYFLLDGLMALSAPMLILAKFAR